VETGSRSLSILIVDDEPALLDVITDLLTEAGYHVRISNRGRAALEDLLEDPDTVDVILSDIFTPDLNGLDLYHAAVRRHPSLSRRFIFMTGDAVAAREGLGSLPIRVLQKPIRLGDLLDEVERVGHEAFTPAAAGAAAAPA
jgi:DNA-binding NtrC family response regulator